VQIRILVNSGVTPRDNSGESTQHLILLKNPRSSFETLKTNGGAIEIIGDFPFMLSLVEAFLGFFSGILFLRELTILAHTSRGTAWQGAAACLRLTAVQRSVRHQAIGNRRKSEANRSTAALRLRFAALTTGAPFKSLNHQVAQRLD
jgi:hypothetical protein